MLFVRAPASRARCELLGFRIFSIVPQLEARHVGVGQPWRGRVDKLCSAVVFKSSS